MTDSTDTGQTVTPRALVPIIIGHRGASGELKCSQGVSVHHRLPVERINFTILSGRNVQQVVNKVIG